MTTYYKLILNKIAEEIHHLNLSPLIPMPENYKYETLYHSYWFKDDLLHDELMESVQIKVQPALWWCNTPAYDTPYPPYKAAVGSIGYRLRTPSIPRLLLVFHRDARYIHLTMMYNK